MDHTIGVKEFSVMIGADAADVSRAVAAGRIRGKCGPNSRGPGSKLLKLDDAETIAAAVRCGVPWLVAADSIDRLRPFKGGIVILEGATVPVKEETSGYLTEEEIAADTGIIRSA